MDTEKDIITRFMTRSFEKSVDYCMLSDKNYAVPKHKVLQYIDSVLCIPYSEFIDYVKENKGTIEDNQLTQSSNFAACSSEMCTAIESQGNPGMRFVDIGQLFPQYIKQQNEAAFRKYGENQVKTSAQLGLTFQYYDLWYLTCVGYIYNDLDKQQQDSLLARTILRTPLYHHVIIRLLEEVVDLSDYMHSLSNSTKGRRVGSILKMINICLAECRREEIKYYDLFYPTYTAQTKTLKMNRQFGTIQYDEPSSIFSEYGQTSPISHSMTMHLVPPGSKLNDVITDDDVQQLIHSMMELNEGTTIIRIAAECQKEYQERYFRMDSNDWLHLIGDYVRKITNRIDIKEETLFYYKVG